MSESRSVIELTPDMPQLEAYIERLSIVTSLAFEHDPFTLPAVGIPYRNNPELHHKFSEVQLRCPLTGAGRVFGVFVGGTEPRNLVGCATWFEPGKEFLGDGAQLSLWSGFVGNLSPEIQNWWSTELLPRYNKFTVEGLGEGVKKGLLHLQVLAVHPEFQRRGLGAALVNEMVKRTDAKGERSCVETAKATNLLFYGALGYKVKSEVLIPSPHGDYTMWCLDREAQSA
ncbi:hypothetical protein BDV93DRAFT_517508 [Ceratobasidium sp. AG-I]|nr:hypothetical protein BDV93DRAFT_517508 [Ceratobasidium sp. AG-I]